MAKPTPRIYMQIGALVALVLVVGFGATSSSKIFGVEYEKSSGQTKGSSSASSVSAVQAGTRGAVTTPAEAVIPVIATHLPTPNVIKSIYMSQCVAGTPSFRAKLVKVADETEINAIVIDIKDYSGRIGYTTNNPLLKDSVSDTCRAPDIASFINSLHEKGIYVIGRITVFQDPYASKMHPERAVRRVSDGSVWKDGKGLSFIDVGSHDHWDYIVELSKESYKLGFDELNFDYVRFPSDGDMTDAKYTLSVEKGKTKPEALEEFFTYLRAQLQPIGVKMSADLFGMVTTNHDDLGIGQVLERALPHFDYIDPMVYPSHFPPKFNGWPDPNKVPGQLIKFVMDSAVQRANDLDHSFGTSTPDALAHYNAQSYKKLRPWLQDFDYGGNYDVPEIRAQIQSTYAAGLTSWMLWAPSNIYTVGALEK